MNNINVFIGYDSWQDHSDKYPHVINPPFCVTKESILQHHTNKNVSVSIKPIVLTEQIECDRYYRKSDNTASSEFTYTRFLVPDICGYEGVAVFCDSDFLWRCDITELLNYYNEKYSVMCVQHDYVPKFQTKMDGKSQAAYPRKNWSSLMMFNCAHSDCKNLSVDSVNTKPPRWLHRMEWTHDKNIGDIPLEYNWLEGEYDSSVSPKAIHFTNGGPWHQTWTGDYKELWEDVVNIL